MNTLKYNARNFERKKHLKGILFATLLLAITFSLTGGNISHATAYSDGVVLVGAGDISTCSSSNDSKTANLVANIPGTVFTTGDNAYDSGTYTQYINCYKPTWGLFKGRTKPVPGNHEYATSGATGYFDYFGVPRYYAYNLGAWRIYALNSEINTSSTSAQVQWLKNDLAANRKKCVLAYWHRPRWSSGTEHGSDAKVQPLWQVLANAHAELVINGHEHNYERFRQMNANGQFAAPGMREFVVGTGGRSLYRFGTILSNSVKHSSNTYGVLKLTLYSDRYDWQFIPVAGQTFADSGTGYCY